MRRLMLALGLALGAAGRSSLALAEPPVSSSHLVDRFGGETPPAAVGLAVVALAGATDAAWPLARAIYAEASLRPTSMDEPRARVLCGEPAPSGAPPDVRDLAETVAALRGDDAPSRALLGDIARRFSVRAVVVVRVDAGRPSARAFLADAGSFDAATYTPDGAGPPSSWSAPTRSLVRAFGSDSAPVAHAPTLATHEAGNGTPPPHRQFYESGWFWGALGAAAFAGGAVFLATRDSSASAIHLHMEVPP
jgi:hypothetical protein